MEWVEVRGDTLEAAKEEALDQLGVALEDAEFEVVQEAESRWMGLKKTEARVRARVRPTQPRPKKEANRGGRRRGGKGNGESSSGSQRGGKGQRKSNGDGRSSGGRDRGGKGRSDERGASKSADRSADTPREKSAAPSGQTDGTGQRRNRDDAEKKTTKKETPVSDQSQTDELVPLDEQQALVTEFLEGVVSGFGATATISMSMDEDTIIASVDGDDLGLMIGPQGGTLRSIQELSRSALQRGAAGRGTSRLRIDVAGYRERRRAALGEFAEKQAAQVKDEGVEVALEPMNSADRKAIHDAVMEIDGVRSISEGDDPQRRVVLLPDD